MYHVTEWRKPTSTSPMRHSFIVTTALAMARKILRALDALRTETTPRHEQSAP